MAFHDTSVWHRPRSIYDYQAITCADLIDFIIQNIIILLRWNNRLQGWTGLMTRLSCQMRRLIWNKQKKSLRRRVQVQARLFDQDKKVCNDWEFPKHTAEQEIRSKGRGVKTSGGDCDFSALINANLPEWKLSSASNIKLRSIYTVSSIFVSPYEHCKTQELCQTADHSS